MIQLYENICGECSRLVTRRYSTSFSLGIRLFHKKYRAPVYALYGFVRFADEIVDSFHGYDKKLLLTEFRRETFKGIDQRISMNPVLHSFQNVVNNHGIDPALIEAFLDSMEMDLDKVCYDRLKYEKYIYGSAEVVGLMCLKIFCEGNKAMYEELVPSARALGSAFQKINFLRDIRDDYYNKGRVYFPGVDIERFDNRMKREIEMDIEKDFATGLDGIRKLPHGARLGVYIAYIFYHNLFHKIKRLSFNKILSERVRIKNRRKAYLLAKYSLKHSLNII